MALGMHALADDGAGPPIPGRCHISAVFVNPAAWGQGIGGRVVDALLAEAEHRGYRAAQLWTQTGNERALRLYQGRGFRLTGRQMPIDDEVVLHLERT
jgi:ribosomal protein S18 acetylase RimI-like enzyme